MPIPTAFHQRTSELCKSLNYREWAGYHVVSSYASHHEHEYNAIRQSVAVIDVSPLFKYSVSGLDAMRLVNRIVTRDVRKLNIGRVFYTPWCDERGKVIDDGTISRLAERYYRWTAADPNLRWLSQNARGLDVQIDDISESLGALAVQGPLSGKLLAGLVHSADIQNLSYFGVTSGEIEGVPVEITRTGYSGDLGYELWIPRENCLQVWDALMKNGRDFDIHPAGMIALDVVRIEAGLLLIEVDFNSSKKAVIDSQKYSPFEMGLGRLVDLEKEYFVGQSALIEENRTGHPRQIVGLDIDLEDVEVVYQNAGLPPEMSATASRAHIPVYQEGRQVGKATSMTWSPTLKKLLALGTVETGCSSIGTQLQVELTVEAVHQKVKACVVSTPFFNPLRKTKTPIEV